MFGFSLLLLLVMEFCLGVFVVFMYFDQLSRVSSQNPVGKYPLTLSGVSVAPLPLLLVGCEYGDAKYAILRSKGLV